VSPEALERIVSFETNRYLRDRMTWVALAAFCAVILIGAIDYWNSLPPRPDGSRLFTEACLVLLSLAFHASIAQDRLPHFDRFLVANFVGADVLYFAKVISGALFLIALATIAFIVALIASLGDLAYAAEHSIIFLASSLVLLPIVVMFELVLATRYTVPLILAIFISVMAVLNSTGNLPGFLHWAGLDDELTAIRGIIRTVVALAVTASLYPLYRRRLGLVR
jgi:hypothetical protein